MSDGFEDKKVPERRSGKLCLIALALVLSVLASVCGAVSFDADVQTLGGPQSKDRAAARQRLETGGKEAVKALVRGLDDSDRGRRTEILRSLSTMKKRKGQILADADDISALAKKARLDKAPAMRAYALNAIANVGGVSATKELEAFASDDPDEIVRNHAISALGEIGAKDPAFFQSRTKDPSDLVKLSAYWELAQAGDKSGRDLALRVLSRPANESETRLAIAVLGDTGKPEDISVLTHFADSSKARYSTKLMAREAVKSIQLFQLPPDGRLPFLLKALDDSDAVVRDWAYTQLWRWPDPTTSARLTAYLAEPGHKGYQEASRALNARR